MLDRSRRRWKAAWYWDCDYTGGDFVDLLSLYCCYFEDLLGQILGCLRPGAQPPTPEGGAIGRERWKRNKKDHDLTIETEK